MMRLRGRCLARWSKVQARRKIIDKYHSTNTLCAVSPRSNSMSRLHPLSETRLSFQSTEDLFPMKRDLMQKQSSLPHEAAKSFFIEEGQLTVKHQSPESVVVSQSVTSLLDICGVRPESMAEDRQLSFTERSGVMANTKPKKEKAVTFSPAALLLDVCQYGPSADPDYLCTLREILHGVPSLDINAISTPQKGLTPLHQACTHGQVAIVELLLSETPIMVNVADMEGWTPLHCACAEGHVEIVKLLGKCQGLGNGGKAILTAGGDEWFCPPDGPIDLTPINFDGEVPEDIAIEDRAEEISQVLNGELSYPAGHK